MNIKLVSEKFNLEYNPFTGDMICMYLVECQTLLRNRRYEAGIGM
jgi:hypothetical protein